MRAIAFHPANQTRNTLAAIFAIALSVVPLSAAQAQTAQQRLQAIFAMSPEEMAATSAFTRRAYEAQIAQIYRIQNKQIREIVLELVRNPVRHRVRSEEQPVVAGVARERLEKPPRLSGRASRPYDGVGGSRQRLGRRLRPRIRREARP